MPGAEVREFPCINLDEYRAASEPKCESGEFTEILGSSRALCSVLEHVRTVAPTDATVLIEGETGTGKELIARAIHMRSKRGAARSLN
jgi:transcriptional regulator with GAF, ATPase, and Fis domain